MEYSFEIDAKIIIIKEKNEKIMPHNEQLNVKKKRRVYASGLSLY